MSTKTLDKRIIQRPAQADLHGVAEQITAVVKLLTPMSTDSETVREAIVRLQSIRFWL